MKGKYLKNVSTLKLDSGKCTGCGTCISVCPHNVFDMSNGEVKITDADLCMECGACEKNCPFQAISVKQGVGCAAYLISGIMNGGKPSCGGPDSDGGCC